MGIDMLKVFNQLQLWIYLSNSFRKRRDNIVYGYYVLDIDVKEVFMSNPNSFQEV